MLQRWITAGLVLGLVGGAALTARAQDLETDEAKTGYSVGVQVGKAIRSKENKLDLDAFARGFKDAMDDKEELALDEETMQTFAMGYQQKLMAERQAEAQAEQAVAGEANTAEATEFLAKNKEAEGVKTTESGLQYKVIKEGDGASPTAESTVKVHYTGTFLDGETFDSSRDRGEPIEFPLAGVIPGWTEGLQLMKVGGQMQFWIPSDLAYGPSGRGGIPPNKLLVFDVELLEVK
jgi:FKBP-type peptidyl-prolyl cis-trans isomerase FkpA/FKBP-type peptidyl-prolyl cis-trans isomerase FklB